MASPIHRQRVGAELRQIREDSGLSGTSVANALGWSQSKLSRVETARFAIDVWELASLLDYYGVPEEVRAELLAVTAEDSGLNGAWIVRAGGSPRRQGELAAVESRVTRIRQYQAMFLPGQLQSVDYAREIVSAGGFPNVDAIVERRRQRQRLIEGDDSPEYSVVLDERALSRWPGSPEVMLDQIQFLGHRASLPSVNLRIIPEGGMAKAMAMASFVIYDFKDRGSPKVVFLETQTADMYLSAEKDVEAYSHLFEALQKDSLSPTRSKEYLSGLAQCVKETQG